MYQSFKRVRKGGDKQALSTTTIKPLFPSKFRQARDEPVNTKQ